MTLTELKYIVALAQARHFGRAAAACFVSQPSLSLAVKKLEDELQVHLFERHSAELQVTPLGEAIVRQAQAVLAQVETLRQLARQGKDPLDGPLALGVIYTIAPYLLPALVPQVIRQTPQMPLILQENFTHRLLEQLRAGEIDCALLAEPFDEAGLAKAALYAEPFVAALPPRHRLTAHAQVDVAALQNEHLLLLGQGHCFRDHVLQVCPEQTAWGEAAGAGSLRQRFEGTSLETLKHMVAAGLGVTLVPRLSVPEGALAQPDDAAAGAARATPSAAAEPLGLSYRPLAGAPPTRRVVLTWRRSFTRYAAVAALRNAIYACALPGCARLS